MAVTMWYRGIDFLKTHMVKYLTYVFFAHDKGQLVITDGTVKAEFSRVPTVIKMYSWTAQETPAVLVGDASGGFDYITFSKDRVYTEAHAPSGEYEYVGGDINVTMDLSVRARTIPERDLLVDVVCIFLSNPTAKDYFNQHAITLPEGPRIGGSSQIPNADYPIYATNLSIPLNSQWHQATELGDRISTFVTDVTGYMNVDIEI